MKTRFWAPTKVILIIVLVVIGVLALKRLFPVPSASSAEPGIGVVTDPAKYATLRAQLGDGAAVQHFPLTIPTEAINVRFYYRPSLFQGGTSFQLRLTLPTDQVDKQYSEFSAQAIHSYIGGDTNVHVNLSDGVPTTLFFTGDNAQQSFPTTYEILVLGAMPYGDSNFIWNHGMTYGVAINNSESIVVYWLEDW
ncbi:MAG: hypothetical protein FJZ96_08030 [Chloroflexi bacterium]|nr:hypothetical protein [Chloroflexota bacterium]